MEQWMKDALGKVEPMTDKVITTPTVVKGRTLVLDGDYL